VIEHFAARNSDPALSDSVLPGASSSGANGSNATGLQELENIATELTITVEQDVPVGQGSGRASRSCCTIQSLVGRVVTLKCRTRRRPCAMTKKQ